MGIDGMGELAVSFQLSNHFFDEQGQPASLIRIAEALGQAFNFNFGDIYKTKSRIFMRKPYNRTKSLDFLRTLVIREGKKKDGKR